MKACSSGLNTHIQQGQTTLTTLLQVTRLADGVIYGFTEHDQNIVLGGVTYVSTTSYDRANLNSKIDDATSTTELSGAFDSIITRADALAGLWDHAQLQLLLVNWSNLSQGAMILDTGSFGVFHVQEFGFKVQLHGLAYPLTFVGGELCSPICRVDFGSAKCALGGALADGTTINSLLQTGTVDASDGSRTMVVTGLTNTGKPFNGGLVTFLTGNNQKLSGEVLSVDFTVPVTGVVSPPLPPNPPTTEDILDWIMIGYPLRTTHHLTGPGTYSANWLDADGLKFWLIKNAAGNPWDINTYDDTYIYHYITENADTSEPGGSHWGSPTAFKRHVTLLPVMPRLYDPTLGPVTITTAGPNHFTRTLACETDGEPLLSLGTATEITSGPFTMNFGGDVGVQPTIINTHLYGSQREQFFYVKFMGLVQWQHSNLISGSWVVDQTTVHNILTAGGCPTPNFPCYSSIPGAGFGGSWIGGTPGAGGNVGAYGVSGAVTGTGGTGTGALITLRPTTLLGTILPGDTFSIFPACDKTFATCSQVWLNGLNFQGEPHAPNPDAVISYPDYVAPHS